MEFPTYLNDRVSPFHATRHLHQLSVYMEGITYQTMKIFIFSTMFNLLLKTQNVFNNNIST